MVFVTAVFFLVWFRGHDVLIAKQQNRTAVGGRAGGRARDAETESGVRRLTGSGHLSGRSLRSGTDSGYRRLTESCCQRDREMWGIGRSRTGEAGRCEGRKRRWDGPAESWRGCGRTRPDRLRALAQLRTAARTSQAEHPPTNQPPPSLILSLTPHPPPPERTTMHNAQIKLLTGKQP